MCFNAGLKMKVAEGATAVNRDTGIDGGKSQFPPSVPSACRRPGLRPTANKTFCLVCSSYLIFYLELRILVTAIRFHGQRKADLAGRYVHAWNLDVAGKRQNKLMILTLSGQFLLKVLNLKDSIFGAKLLRGML